MAKRKAPWAGYDFEAKDKYRERIWSVFQSFAGDRRRITHAVLMPSLEGKELDVAIRRGFRQENLHAIDNNAAIIVSLRRRYPHIHPYGTDITKAFERLAKSHAGRIKVANLDLCNCLGDPVLEALESVGASAAWSDRALIAVTVLRGRERKEQLDWARIFAVAAGVYPNPSLTQTDLARISEIALACATEGFVFPFVADKYTSVNGQSMLWMIFRRWKHSYKSSGPADHAQVHKGLCYTHVLAAAALAKMCMEDPRFMDTGAWRERIGDYYQDMTILPTLKVLCDRAGLTPYLKELAGA